MKSFNQGLYDMKYPPQHVVKYNTKLTQSEMNYKWG